MLHLAPNQTAPRARVTIALLFGMVAVSLGVAACSGPGEPSPTDATATPSAGEKSKQAGQAEVLSLGAELYAANWQVCHGDREGAGGTAGAPPHNQDGHTWHHPDAQLKDWVLNGKLGRSQMPPFKDKLTEEEVDAVLAYIKTWWTEEQRASQADVSRWYQESLEEVPAGQGQEEST